MKSVITIFVLGTLICSTTHSEEYLFTLPLTRSLNQIENGVSTRNYSKSAGRGGELLPTRRRIVKDKGVYYHENTYQDGQIIKNELTLLGDSQQQIWFYWKNGIAPRLIVLSKISKSVIIADIASFNGDMSQKEPFTEVIIEYGSYTSKE